MSLGKGFKITIILRIQEASKGAENGASNGEKEIVKKKKKKSSVSKNSKNKVN